MQLLSQVEAMLISSVFDKQVLKKKNSEDVAVYFSLQFSEQLKERKSPWI